MFRRRTPDEKRKRCESFNGLWLNERCVDRNISSEGLRDKQDPQLAVYWTGGTGKRSTTVSMYVFGKRRRSKSRRKVRRHRKGKRSKRRSKRIV